MTFSIFPCFWIRPDVFQSPPERRHPERSASQIYRISTSLWREVEGPRRCLLGRCSSELSGHELQGKLKKSQPLSGAHLSRETALVARSRRTPAVLILPMLLVPFRSPKPENRMLRYVLAVLVLGPTERRGGFGRCGLRWLKDLSRMGKTSTAGVLRLRAN